MLSRQQLTCNLDVVGDHHHLQVCALQQQQRAAAVRAEEHQPGVAAGPRDQGPLPLGRGRWPL